MMTDTVPIVAATPVVLRPHRPADMDWVVERHATLYGREYGWGGQIGAMGFLTMMWPPQSRARTTSPAGVCEVVRITGV